MTTAAAGWPSEGYAPRHGNAQGRRRSTSERGIIIGWKESVGSSGPDGKFHLVRVPAARGRQVRVIRVGTRAEKVGCGILDGQTATLDCTMAQSVRAADEVVHQADG